MRETLTFQPIPAVTLVSHFETPGEIITAITRVWSAGDSARCRLCHSCMAEGGVCLIQVRGFVSLEAGQLFSTKGLMPQGRPGLRVIGNDDGQTEASVSPFPSSASNG